MANFNHIYQIYRSRINTEEMRTGRKSTKSKDISFYEAVEDPETRTEYIHRQSSECSNALPSLLPNLQSRDLDLQRLHALTKAFVNAIITSTRRMPYGMRCMARETLSALRVSRTAVKRGLYCTDTFVMLG